MVNRFAPSVSVIPALLFLWFAGCPAGEEGAPLAEEPLRKYAHTSEEGFYLEQGTWTPMYRYTRSFDDAGRLTEHAEALYMGGPWVNGTRKVYTYLPDGKIERRDEYNGSTGEWLLYHRYEYAYTPGGRLSEITGYLHCGGGHFEEIWKQTVTYDGYGRVVRDVRDDYNGDCWDAAFIDEYAYDGNGRLETLRSSIVPLGGPPMGTYRCDYAYDGSGRLLWETGYGDDGGVWSPNTRTAHLYDPSGALLSATTSRWEGSAWVLDHRDEFAYDPEGRLHAKTRQNRFLGSWIDAQRNVYHRDGEGRLVEVSQEDPAGGTWFETGRWVYSLVETPSGAFFPSDHLPAARPLNWEDWTNHGGELNRYAGN